MLFQKSYYRIVLSVLLMNALTGFASPLPELQDANVVQGADDTPKNVYAFTPQQDRQYTAINSASNEQVADYVTGNAQRTLGAIASGNTKMEEYYSRHHRG